MACGIGQTCSGFSCPWDSILKPDAGNIVGSTAKLCCDKAGPQRGKLSASTWEIQLTLAALTLL